MYLFQIECIMIASSEKVIISKKSYSLKKSNNSKIIYQDGVV